ncbi:hypothetical protein SB394_16680 [Burkholderia sp. BCCIQ04A]|uniref:PIN domain-containing protein n=1 Tax=Burkholderia anthinoferrum TaxID=3090833 RepID=A0ABU5WKZ4_9BURK|nr:MULTISPECIES: hypothetical protein [Burkholderia]MEB2503650.1 hypothetical protein [Burkholderia anthinoferrum]MEB2535100.1 hypothetical protein [Burkholderia anthinoferrum]MEB2560880.1 hypothetical protein [Burkholderia anthinoferrum]MEB2579426.1 hypothetical protein [Burkholderia anthinoferrum]MDF3098898.1 hypothetical protein [Burkholderia semiarida]
MNIYFDNNTLANLVQAGIDPVAALADSEFTLAVTPDLATEYQQGIQSDNTTVAEKDLCRRLLAAATERGIFGFAGPDGSSNGYSGFDHGYWADEGTVQTLQSIKVTERPGKAIPKNRTDAFLVALAAGAIVITNDTGKHFRLAREKGHHVYSWAELVDVGNIRSTITHRLGVLLTRST